MQRPTPLVLLSVSLFLVACGGEASDAKHPAFDAAEVAVSQYEFRRAADLFRQAIQAETDPDRRARAAARAAHIEWKMFGDANAARAILKGRTDAPSLLQRSRMETELTRDFAAAHSAAVQAQSAAKTRGERIAATVSAARAILVPSRDARMAGRCAASDQLTSTVQALRERIEKDGPFLDPSLTLIDAAILAGDGGAAWQGVRWYYGLSPATSVANAIAPAVSVLERELPTWRGNSSLASQRRTIALALAGARFFPQAAMLLGDACATEKIAHDDDVRTIIAYAAALETIDKITRNHYRDVARDKGDASAFRKAVQSAWENFGKQLPKHSEKELMREVERRFGTYSKVGKSNDVRDLHLGHAILDESIDVEQYGRRAPFRFVVLDAMTSNGFLAWATDGRSQDGGWHGEGEIYQVRPAYADGAIWEWLAMTDPETREKQLRETAQESRRDDQLAATTPIAPMPGLSMRLDMQANEQLFAELKAKGLAGDALRDAFIARVRDDIFASSFRAHEGRHALDKKHGGILRFDAELEYRAKLSEIALAPSPRRALAGGIMDRGVGADTGHGKANHRIYREFVKWMTAHASEIRGLDTSKPLLPQLDKLSDDQLRAVARSLDPLAK
jgi:hypothetical protein